MEEACKVANCAEDEEDAKAHVERQRFNTAKVFKRQIEMYETKILTMNSNIQTITDGFNAALRQMERKDKNIKTLMEMHNWTMVQIHEVNAERIILMNEANLAKIKLKCVKWELERENQMLKNQLEKDNKKRKSMGEEIELTGELTLSRNRGI